MTTLTLTILAEDILDSNYMDANDCAITRALKRTEYSDYIHCGIDIIRKENGTEVILVTNKNLSFRKMNKTVNQLYNYKSKKQFDKIVDTEIILKIK